MKEISKMKMLNTMCIKTSVSALSLLAAIALVGPPTIGNASMTVTPGLTITNDSNADVIIAVHYKDRGNWRTTSFISIPTGQQKNAVVYSNNSVFYYYAKSNTGVWRGDYNFNVDGKMYPMKKKTLNLDRERNRFYLRLTD